MLVTTNVPPEFLIGAEAQTRVSEFSSTGPNGQRNEASEELKEISAFFPLPKNRQLQQARPLQKPIRKIDESNEQVYDGGRFFETVHGDNVFIPALNLETVCSTTECSGDNFNKNSIGGDNLPRGILI